MPPTTSKDALALIAELRLFAVRPVTTTAEWAERNQIIVELTGLSHQYSMTSQMAFGLLMSNTTVAPKIAAAPVTNINRNRSHRRPASQVKTGT